MYSLENVYCIAPSFRAEKSRTIRHLTEYWHIEGEWAFADMNDLMKFEEGLMEHICQTVSEKCQKEFKELGANIEKLKAVQAPFPRITYKEAIERLKPKNPALDWGSTLGMKMKKCLLKTSVNPSSFTITPQRSKRFTAKPTKTTLKSRCRWT
jgi:asparaginyl-tRNA synthetase